MATLEIKIAGYDVYLDTDMDGDGHTGCWVSLRNYWASLEALMAEGVLLNGDDEHRVHSTTIDEIAQWAEDNGF